MATRLSPSAVNRSGNERDEDQPQEQLPNGPPRATQQPHRGGYDCEFVKPPPVEFPQTDCPVCLLVLREPHQASCCGNSYCESCVKRVQHDKKCCPSCNEAHFAVFPDKRLKLSLYAMNVYCCQRREGCEWKGELGDLDRHLNLQPPPEKLLVGCQLAEVDCTYCVQPFQRRYVQAHQSDDCVKRPYTCQHCNNYAATFEEVTQSHWLMCTFFPLSCPNSCELVLQRQEVEHHVSRDCPLTLIQCDFHAVGCQKQLTRRDMPSHISENLTKHMSLLQVHIMSHPGESATIFMRLMVGSIQKIAVENSNMHSELYKAQEKLRETQNELQQSHIKLQEAAKELQETCKAIVQLKKTVTSQNKLIVKRAKEMQIQDAMLNQHQKTLEKVMCTGALPFEFTMTEFEKHKRASDKWYCPPFYTHTCGYRMCIRVDANGYLSGKGTHLSVFGYLMQSDHDIDLQWPFQGAITLQLLNQLEDNNHYTHIINFVRTADPTVTDTVTSNERAGTGWGTPTFLSHTQLGLNTDCNCQFLKDNQLKFRVSKATYLDPTAHIYRRCLALENFAGAIEPHVCVAPIEFTLSDFREQKKQNDVWHSPAFYTHPQGYRMCLKVYPNGDGSGLGRYVSVYTCIMRGPFDGGLKWPFRGAIAIHIVNQAEDNHEEKTINYTDQVPNTYTSRVIYKARSQGWGYHHFLSHRSLAYNAARNTQYLQRDCLRIRIPKLNGRTE